LKIFTIINVFFQTEDSPSLEINWLRNNLAEDVCIIQSLKSLRSSLCRLLLLLLLDRGSLRG